MAFTPMLVAGISLLFLVMGFGSASGLYQLEILGLSLTGEGAPLYSALLIVFGIVGLAYCCIPQKWRRRKR